MAFRNETEGENKLPLLDIICPYRHTPTVWSSIGKGGSYNTDEIPYIKSVLCYHGQGFSEDLAELMSAIEFFGMDSEEYQTYDRMSQYLNIEVTRPAYELHLSIPLLNKLNKGDTSYVGDIMRKSDEELDEIPGIGRATIRKLREKVLYHFIPIQTDRHIRKHLVFI